MPFILAIFIAFPLSLSGLLFKLTEFHSPEPVSEWTFPSGSGSNLAFEGLAAGMISDEILDKALTGYSLLCDSGRIGDGHLLVVIDFTKNSTEERFYLFDLDRRQLLHRSLVAHGRNSGGDLAVRFSNEPNSLQSSLGFFLCAETYKGQHGLSMRLDGLEKGINDNARKRNIVVHSADYVHPEFIGAHGRLGRSFGCPALPVEGYSDLIALISTGCLLFIYAEDPEYMLESALMGAIGNSGLSSPNYTGR